LGGTEDYRMAIGRLLQTGNPSNPHSAMQHKVFEPNVPVKIPILFRIKARGGASELGYS